MDSRGSPFLNLRQGHLPFTKDGKKDRIFIQNKSKMAATIIPIAPSTSFFHVLGSETQPGADGLPCDPWHVAGLGSFHADPSDAQLIQAAKSILPPQPFPIRIGFTGYINWATSPFGQNGYTHDQTGRIVIALGIGGASSVMSMVT
jgi:hypothetical protein